jgi:hypothetical protein
MQINKKNNKPFPSQKKCKFEDSEKKASPSASLGRPKGAEWSELSREFMETFIHDHSVNTNNDLNELKSLTSSRASPFVKKIGSNRLLGGKKVSLDLVSPLDLIDFVELGLRPRFRNIFPTR